MKLSKITKSLFILTALSIFLFFVRYYYTGERLGVFLIWNLFLAWMPLFFALVARRLEEKRKISLLFMGLWLLFFPNAPYIITDLVHLSHLPDHLWWYDSLGIFVCAFTGLLVGIYSISVVHEVVRRFYGSIKAWLLVLSSMVLGGFGIYLGRWSRLNSWEIVSNPVYLFQKSFLAIQEPLAIKTTLLFSLVMTVFYFAYYLVTKEHELTKDV